MNPDPASFRDPAGRVYPSNGRIFRTVDAHGLADYAFVKDSGALAPLVDEGLVIETREVDGAELRKAAPTCQVVLEHPRLPFWSYPYEWPFEALKTAALTHLDIQMRLLGQGIALADASAYNVQFRGNHAVFVDALSFRRYRDREHWTGYRQFCEQFLNPLLLQAVFGIPFQPWYRGQPDGVPTVAVAALARARHYLSPRLLAHVLAPARLQAQDPDTVLKKAINARTRGLPMPHYHALLAQLRNWIAALRPKKTTHTPWATYDTNPPEDSGHKRDIVARFAASTRPALLLDLGCNTGAYAAHALAHGVDAAVGVDSDGGALEQAFSRARGNGLNFLPLYQDCADPSPGQGWNNREHKGLTGRCGAVDAVMALAFEHHLAIGRNVPLPDVVRWIASLAPQGLIEFVPKDDPTVRRMLALRDDVFDDYALTTFTTALSQVARIVNRQCVSRTGRTVFHFERKPK